MRFSPLYGALTLVIASPLYAQDATSSEEDVVVTATRTDGSRNDSPQVIKVITEKEIAQQRQLTSDTSQILSNLLPSFSPSRQKMSGSGETLRGRTPLVMIDGIPQSNPLRPTGREMHTVDASMIERIEVIKGANTSNGVGATGGVINIITKRAKPGTANQHFSIETTTPTSELNHDTLAYKTNYSINGSEEYLDYLFALSYEDQGLFKDANNHAIGVDNTQGDLMDSRAWDLLAKVGYWLDNDQRVQLSLNRYRLKNKDNYVSVTGDRDAGRLTTSRKGTPEGTAPHNDVWTVGTTYDNYNLAGMKLTALAYYQRYEALFGATNSSSFQDPQIAPIGTLYDQSRAYTDKYGSKIALTKDDIWDDRIKATVGFDTLFDNSKQDLWSTGRTYVPEINYTDLSPFLQLEYAPVESVKLSGGIRYEYARLKIDSYQTVWANDRVTVEGGTPSFDETLYNAGVVWTPITPLSLFASYSEGFTVPDVGRVLRGIDTPGVKLSDYNSLQPIITKNSEVGFRVQQAPFDFETSYYKSTSKLGSRVELLNDAFVARREKTEIDGVEVSAGYAPNADHKLTLAWSHMRGRYDSDDNGSLDAKLDGLNIAPDRIIASWSANWNTELSTFLQANWALSKKFDDEEKDFSGYAIVDAAVGYKLPYGQLSLGISNLLNKQYVTYYSQSASVDPDRYFAGRGRTATLGYSLNF